MRGIDYRERAYKGWVGWLLYLYIWLGCLAYESMKEASVHDMDRNVQIVMRMRCVESTVVLSSLSAC